MGDVALRQSVPAEHLELQVVSDVDGTLSLLERSLASGWCLRVGVPTRPEFDTFASYFGRRAELVFDGFDEADNDNARLREPLHGALNAIAMADHVESAFGRDLLALLGNQRTLVRFEFHGDVDDLVGDGHLHVELDADSLFEHARVTIVDVPAILSQMERDAVGAAQLRLRRRPARLRLVPTPWPTVCSENPAFPAPG